MGRHQRKCAKCDVWEDVEPDGDRVRLLPSGWREIVWHPAAQHGVALCPRCAASDPPYAAEAGRAFASTVRGLVWKGQAVADSAFRFAVTDALALYDRTVGNVGWLSAVTAFQADCPHAPGVVVPLGSGAEWCRECGSVCTSGRGAGGGTWLLSIRETERRAGGGGAASILESLGHNSTAAAAPTRSGVEKPSSAEQFSADAPSSASAPPAKGVRVSYLEDSSDNGTSWETREAGPLWRRLRRLVGQAAPPWPPVDAPDGVIPELAAALQAAHARGWADRDRTACPCGSRVVAAETERDEARRLVRALLGPLVDHFNVAQRPDAKQATEEASAFLARVRP